MTDLNPEKIFDFVIIGSGFGGSVSAMRLQEKGYDVLVLEKGKHFKDSDFPRTNWTLWKYLWLPALRLFGILQVSLLKGVMILHGNGVGGGSLGYANVLEVPPDEMFNNPAWKHLADWKSVLRPHYETARRMLGATVNPRLGVADAVLKEIAEEFGTSETFRPTDVGVFFGPEGEESKDPYFGGDGPERSGCNFCGGCMVGCRYNAKNTLVKNYLYFAKKYGATIFAESEVVDINPLNPTEDHQARYEVTYQPSTSWIYKPNKRVQAKNVILSGGVLGTLKLLLKCRDISRTLPLISPTLGDLVRTNSEALMGSGSRSKEYDYSAGIAITSIVNIDDVTRVEPVRYPAGSSVMRWLSAPLIDIQGTNIQRFFRTLLKVIRHPLDTIRAYISPGWAKRTTILLIMQTLDNHMKLRLGRSIYTLFKKGLVAEQSKSYHVPTRIAPGHITTVSFAEKTNGVPMGSVGENLLDLPTTAHIMGGCPMGEDGQTGVVNLECQVHNYPGLYVIDGSIVPANPGVNPSLTITALAEYAMSLIKPGKQQTNK